MTEEHYALVGGHRMPISPEEQAICELEPETMVWFRQRGRGQPDREGLGVFNFCFFVSGVIASVRTLAGNTISIWPDGGDEIRRATPEEIAIDNGAGI